MFGANVSIILIRDAATWKNLRSTDQKVGKIWSTDLTDRLNKKKRNTFFFNKEFYLYLLILKIILNNRKLSA
jgi:hypothetical protein